MFKHTINYLILSIMIILSSCVSASNNSVTKKELDSPIVRQNLLITLAVSDQISITETIHKQYYRDVQTWLEERNKKSGKNEGNPYLQPFYKQNYQQINEKETICANTLINIRKAILESKKASLLAREVVKTQELKELPHIVTPIIDDKTLDTPNYRNCQMNLIMPNIMIQSKFIDIILELAAQQTSVVFTSLEDLSNQKYKFEPLTLRDIDNELNDIPEARCTLLRLFDPYAYQE